MSIILEALHFVGMITLEPHRAGQFVTNHVGTNNETKALEKLREYHAALHDIRCKKHVAELIEAFEAQR